MKKRIILLVFSSILLISSSKAFAMPLSLERFYHLAVSRNENVRIQTEAVIQSEALYQQTFGTVMPQIRLLATHTFQDSGGTGSGAGTVFTSTDQPNYRLNLRQNLFSGFREWTALHAQQTQIAQQRETLQQTKRQLFQEITSLFVTLLKLEKEAENLNLSKKTTQARIEELKNRVRLGKSRQSELLNVQAQMAAFMAQIESNLLAQRTARQSLGSLSGLNENQIAVSDLNEVQKLPDIETLAQKITSKNAFLILEYQKIYYSDQIKIQTSHLWPTLALQGNYYLKRQPTLDPIKWDVALSLDMALFQGGSEWGLIAEAQSQLRQIDAVYDKTLREQSLDLLQRVSRQESLLKQQKYFREAFEQSQKSYELIKNEYALGLTNNLEVTQAFSTLIENKKNLDNTEIDIKENWLQLKIFLEELP